jgi:hypothetical protein
VECEEILTSTATGPTIGMALARLRLGGRVRIDGRFDNSMSVVSDEAGNCRVFLVAAGASYGVQDGALDTPTQRRIFEYFQAEDARLEEEFTWTLISENRFNGQAADVPGARDPRRGSAEHAAIDGSAVLARDDLLDPDTQDNSHAPPTSAATDALHKRASRKKVAAMDGPRVNVSGRTAGTKSRRSAKSAPAVTPADAEGAVAPLRTGVMPPIYALGAQALPERILATIGAMESPGMIILDAGDGSKLSIKRVSDDLFEAIVLARSENGRVSGFVAQGQCGRAAATDALLLFQAQDQQLAQAFNWRAVGDSLCLTLNKIEIRERDDMSRESVGQSDAIFASRHDASKGQDDELASLRARLALLENQGDIRIGHQEMHDGTVGGSGAPGRTTAPGGWLYGTAWEEPKPGLPAIKAPVAEAAPARKADGYWNSDRISFGNQSPQMICQQCGVKGHVRTKQVTQKRGISGVKAFGAVVTGGLSLLPFGISSNERVTEAHCGNCNSTWRF